jgi:tRNA pseudouridine55 synthase
MIQGVLLIDKPINKTSFFLVSFLRALTKVKKIGHSGTLDPLATGVMVMLVGKEYTRLSSKFTFVDKEYVTDILLGQTTDTYDTQGTVITTSDLIPSLEEVESAILAFQGNTMQTPPMFSAKKIQGQKLCDLARKGISIERQAVSVNMQITLLEYNYPTLRLKVTCSSGTYIRSLAYDLGARLGCGGTISKLTRTRSGPFTLEECLSVETIEHPSFDFIPHLYTNQDLVSCLHPTSLAAL